MVAYHHIIQQSHQYIEYNGIKLKEFPINTHNILGKPLSFLEVDTFDCFPIKLLKSGPQI